MKTVATLAFLLLLTETLFAQKDVKSFNKARKENTIKAYEEFMEKHPESAFKVEAIDSIYKITGRNVSSKSYFDFYSKYKDSRHSKQALFCSFIIRYLMSNDSARLAALQQDFSGLDYDEYINAKKLLVDEVKNNKLEGRNLIFIDRRDGKSGLLIRHLDKEYKILAKFSDNEFNDKLKSLNINLPDIEYIEVQYANKSAFLPLIHVMEARTYFGKCSDLFPNVKGIKLTGFAQETDEAMLLNLGSTLFTPMSTFKSKNNRIISILL